jgi:hypothetical protein
VKRALFALLIAGCSGAGSVGTISAAVTYPNDGPAFAYFVGKGLSDAQSAGIVGNLDVESGVDPTAVESGGPGRGIAQWSAGARWDTTTDDNAVWYAGTLGENVETLPPQLAFIWYELTTFPDYGLAELQAATDVSDATIAFMTSFEVCGSCASGSRVSDAENVLATFGGESFDFAGVDNGGATPCTTSTGVSGQCLDTSACAALPDHESTPGLCPGASNIQCCTGPSSSDGGTASKRHGGCAMSGATPPSLGPLALVLALLALRRARRAPGIS